MVADGPNETPAGAPTGSTPPPVGSDRPVPGRDPDWQLSAVRSTSEFPAIPAGGLSRYFDPFLPFFVAETIRTGGEVTLLRADGIAAGVMLRRESVRLASIFARGRSEAERLFSGRGPLTTYAEYLLDPRAETLSVLAVGLGDGIGDRPFAHRIRAATPSDRPAVGRLLAEVYGALDEPWWTAPVAAEERAYVAEVGDRLAGVAWVTIVGDSARLHSASVAVRYRHLGIGTDLFRARLGAARHLGARRAITEIADTNGASLAIARTAGLTRLGPMFEIPG